MTHKFRRGLVRFTIHKGGKDEAWKAGWNASNGYLHIKAWSDVDCFAGVMAQERAELHYKWAWGVIFARSVPYLHRRMEYFGHAIDALVASEYYGRTLAEREDIEVRSLASGYDLFKGVTAEQHLAKLRAMYPKARKWITKNRRFVDAMFTYRFPGSA